jgi:DNA-binding GntR family transcriptional regulator
MKRSPRRRAPALDRSRFRSEKDRIYRTLRQEILTLALSPRDLLVETALAQRFRVSKTPVREALAVLQRDGLVEALPRKGYLVTPITVHDVDDLFELRVALEGLAAELAATRMTPGELEHLASLQPPHATDPSAADLQRFLGYNREFHAAIARGSRNARLGQLIEQVNEEMSRMIAASYEIGEHKTVLTALRSGDPGSARAAMVEHITASQTRALKRDVVDFVRSGSTTRPRSTSR